MKRVRLRWLWLVPVAAFGFFVFLWIRAGMDARYMMRVLLRRDSKTDDYTWKRSMQVSPSPTPVPWPVAPGCDAIAATLAPFDMSSYLTSSGTLSLVVVRDGSIVCEWYGNGGAKDKPAAAFSISKTVTSLLLARAVAEGKLASFDTPITDYVPALKSRDPRFAAISLAALVDMRSGIAFDEDTHFPWVDQDSPAVYYASDLAATVVRRPQIEGPPGSFLYNDYAPNLLGLALEHAYGTRLAPGPMQALWSELGSEHAALWSVDDEGFAWHESGLVVTARDLARIGQLLLTGGKVGERQVAPPVFLARSLDPLRRAPVVTFDGTPLGYSNGWWILDADHVVAMGRHGQIILVSFATRSVIIRMGLDGHDETNVSIVRRLVRIAALAEDP